MNILVVPCGTEVIIKTGKISGIVSAIELKFENITYQIAFFIDGKRETVWIHENEFICDSHDNIKIGFK